MRRFLLLIDSESSRTTRIATTCDMTSIRRSMRSDDADETVAVVVVVVVVVVVAAAAAA